MDNNNKDNKQLREIYEQFCDVNNKIIENKSRDIIVPICILITESKNNNKKYDCSIIGFRHRNYEEKQMARKYLFKTITESKTKGYILIQDAKMTCMAKSSIGDKNEVKDVVMRGLYSPNLIIKECVVYDEKERKIIETMKLTDTENKNGESNKDGAKNMIDDWNLYGEWFDEDNPEHNRICNEFNKFKQEHKDKYK